MNIKDAVKLTSSIRPNQYSIGKIEAFDTKYLPREKLLYIVANTRSSDKKRYYKTQLVFKGIRLSNDQSELFPFPYYNDKGMLIGYLPQLTVENEIMSRCSCDDYRWMWHFWNKKEKALLGPVIPYVRKTTTYPERNPDHIPGLCKHQLGLIKKMIEQGLMKKDTFVWNYLTRPARVRQ